MSTTADFYIGQGEEMEWIGSLAHEGFPTALPNRLRLARSENKYREEVTNLLHIIHPIYGIEQNHGWPWLYDTSLRTNYVYSFFDGSVKWACSHRAWVRCSEYKEMSKVDREKILHLPLLCFPKMKNK